MLSMPLISLSLSASRRCQINHRPSAASFKAEIANRGIWHVDADNDVSEGFRGQLESGMRHRRVAGKSFRLVIIFHFVIGKPAALACGLPIFDG